MEKSGLNSTSHGVNSHNGHWWLRFLNGLDKATGDRTWRITIALTGFVLIKVIWISRGNIQTALAVFNSAGLVTVITGGLLSAFPLVSAMALAFIFFVLINRGFIQRDHERPATELGKIESNKVQSEKPASRLATNLVTYENLIWFTGLAAIAGCFFLTPWPIMAASALLGALSGLAAQVHGKRIIKVSLVIIILLPTIVFVLNPLLYAVWLPHEMLTVPKLATKTNPNGEYVFGYVLSDSNGWISVLQTGRRDILRFRGNEVTARALCHGQTVPIPFVQIPRSYKSADPLSRWMLGRGTTIPHCSPPQVYTIGTPICIKSLTSGLTCSGEATGLGNGPTTTFLAANSVTATYICENHAGNVVPGQTVIEQNVTGPTQTITSHNRKITFSLSIPPPTTPSPATKCPNVNWPVVSMSLTYTSVELHIQQPRGIDMLSHSFGDINPADTNSVGSPSG